MTTNQPFSWIIKKFENGQAVLSGGGQELRVPRAEMPPKAKEGDMIAAEFYFLKDQKIRQENLAKALLTEILGPQSEEKT